MQEGDGQTNAIKLPRKKEDGRDASHDHLLKESIGNNIAKSLVQSPPQTKEIGFALKGRVSGNYGLYFIG